MGFLALGPRQIVASLRRTLTEAPTSLAKAFARSLRDAPASRLEWLMRPPARRVVLEAIFWQMPRHLDRKRAATVNTSVRWNITGRGDGRVDSYLLEINEGRCRVIRGTGGPPPRATITVDGAEFLRLATGKSDPIRSYFTGGIALAGDIMAAAGVTSLFWIPGSRR